MGNRLPSSVPFRPAVFLPRQIAPNPPRCHVLCEHYEVRQALCYGGAEGLTIKQLITQVNELGFANWGEKKKAYLRCGVMKVN